MILRSMAGPGELDLLVSLSRKTEISARWVRGLLERGEARPEWCRMAFSPDGELLAAHVLDGWESGGEVPVLVTLLGHADEPAAVALLDHDLRRFGIGPIGARLVLSADATPELRALREAQPRILAAAGFDLAVERVHITWQAATPVPRPTGRLSFRPAATYGHDALVELFAEVGDGSVDHGMVSGRAEHGRHGEAAARLRLARQRRHPDAWFAVGVDEAGAIVGYVQAAADDERRFLAEIGVAASRRGRRYVDELLAYGTAAAADDGAPEIYSHTDVANRGMRAAFARAGYVESGTRRDFHRAAAPKPALPSVP